MTDDRLTPDEQDAFARLPREISPPPGLEDRVIASLRPARAARPASRGSQPWLRIAAALVLLAAGVLAGRVSAGPASPERGDYLLLLYGSANAPGKTENELVAEYSAWASSLRERRVLVAAERLADDATLVGSNAVQTSQPVGFFLIKADTADAATATAQSCPHVKYGGAVAVTKID